MNHLPYILAAYAVGAVVLTWCAVAPLLRLRALRARLRAASAEPRA